MASRAAFGRLVAKDVPGCSQYMLLMCRFHECGKTKTVDRYLVISTCSRSLAIEIPFLSCELHGA
jgi:hypothetical protein